MRQMEFEQFYADTYLNKGRRFIEEAAFELTYRCNLDCVHCYCNSSSLRKKEQELSLIELRGLMDEAAEEGCLWVAFTGGEPLVREDFFDLYLYAKKKGFLVSVLSNATLIDEQAAEFFARWPPKQIEVSLYGVTEEVHERVTGVPGSFRKTTRAIGLLRERQIPLEIKTMALTVNKDEIPSLESYALSIGARFRYDSLIHARLDGDKAPHRYRLAAEDIVELDERMGFICKEWKTQCERYAGVALDREKLYTCGAGRAMFQLDPYGKLNICSFPLRKEYNVRQGSLREGWEQFIPAVISQRRRKSDNRCSACKIRPLCHQCANWAFLENGDEETVVDYICELFKERARRLGIGPLAKKEGMYAGKESV